MSKVNSALISVSDKIGIVEFSKELVKLGVKIISTGGTSKLLSENGISVTDISKITGFPEMMNGRVKTLHPKIHGGILADRSNKSHLKEAKKHNIDLIDLVVVNLYPFEKAIQKKDVSLEEVIENIDIGGPTLIRSAAKNFSNVGVVCDPNQYGKVIKELSENNCSLSPETKKQLAIEAFSHVARYDSVIENYLRKRLGDEKYPEFLNISFKKHLDLRYGENPHQKSAIYIDRNFDGPSVIFGKQLQGKHLSYNNMLDASGAFTLCKEFDEPTAVVVKHNNPSGVASSEKILESYKNARNVDPEAAFGGVVALNRKVEEDLAVEIIKYFVEVIIAPEFSDKAKKVFAARKNLRLLEMPDFHSKMNGYIDYRSIPGGLLVQEADTKLLAGEPKVVTKRKPTKQEIESMFYAWKIAKYVKSNAIVFAKGKRAIGIGAGQMKRVDAAKLAAMVASDYSGKDSLKGCAMASDAFFPFRDGIDFAANLGVTCIIQPGGSIKDEEVIKAADEHDIAMLFTGMRHFRH
ncbi:MAG TPA: bifunctional phosphoribosylaminoimidazolecarboxamide formyltransferase/IMP cyclohydrolase [Candidatus Bilamarchaeaceae archaeon]|nr:bifunctional phosphoribosylaminoimidazolecarboxamide formyltransferase/IMP cyclohydrolase [Candidatus Bilamarchaeaceae archaeon]